MKKLIALLLLLATFCCLADDDSDRVRTFDRDMPDTVLAVEKSCGSKIESAYSPAIVNSPSVIECRSSSLIYKFELSSPNGRFNSPTKVKVTMFDYPSRKDLGGLCLFGMACASKRELDNIQKILESIPITGSKHPALL